MSSFRARGRGRCLDAAVPEGTHGANTLFLAFVQFSSSAEAGERRSSARGPWKLSSVLGAAAEPEGSAATQADPVDI